jgi:hypothetical protein
MNLAIATPMSVIATTGDKFGWAGATVRRSRSQTNRYANSKTADERFSATDNFFRRHTVQW